MCGFDPAPGDDTHNLNSAVYYVMLHVHSFGSREPFILKYI